MGKRKVYLIKVTFEKLVTKWRKLMRAKLFFTTRTKKVPIKKKDIVKLVFYSKKAYEKAREILA